MKFRYPKANHTKYSFKIVNHTGKHFSTALTHYLKVNNITRGHQTSNSLVTMIDTINQSVNEIHV